MKQAGFKTACSFLKSIQGLLLIAMNKARGGLPQRGLPLATRSMLKL